MCAFFVALAGGTEVVAQQVAWKGGMECVCRVVERDLKVPPCMPYNCRKCAACARRGAQCSRSASSAEAAPKVQFPRSRGTEEGMNMERQ